VASVRISARWQWCVALAAGAAVCSLVAPAARGQEVLEAPPPGNLLVNWGFDVDTSGWGSFGGSLARTPNGLTCATTNPGAATVTHRTGGTYTISDSQGGNRPTVSSTVGGDTFIAYATVIGTSASAAGKPGRIVLRERVGTSGSIVKETATRFAVPPVGRQSQVAVSTVAARSGSTLGLRIEQTSAQPGDAFTVDDVFLRRGTRAFGASAPGTAWTRMGGDLVRVSSYSAPGPPSVADHVTRYLDRLRVYLDGRGGAVGAQKLRAVVYSGAGFPEPIFLLRVSREVTIRSGAAARWVDFRFGTPVRLSGFDGATYQFGLLSGATPNVARYASSRAPAALWWGPDTYAGPNPSFATAADGTALPSFRDDKQMSMQGIAAPVGPDDFGTCFG